MKYAVAFVAVVLAAVVAPAARQTAVDAESVRVVRVPEGGLQPRVLASAAGGAHVVYYKGEAAAGNLFYRRITVDGTWSPALQVNTEPGSAIAVGNIRGASLAVTPGERVHVVWNGSSQAVPRAPDGSTPMLYARLNDRGTAFEPERNLVHAAVGLDGGGAIAADPSGREIFVAWHAGGPDAKGEGERRVWLTTSTDGGRTFAPETAVSPAETGACGCCGMAALFEPGGFYLAYRAARDVVHRDAYLLASHNGGRPFTATNLEPWNIGACPMSSFSLARRLGGVVIAWETAGAVAFATIERGQRGPIVTPPGKPGQRKHPAVAVNHRGEVLLAWTDGVAWQRGGSVEWRVFDADGRPTAVTGRRDDVPMWSLVAAYARPDGRFVIVY